MLARKAGADEMALARKAGADEMALGGTAWGSSIINAVWMGSIARRVSVRTEVEGLKSD